MQDNKEVLANSNEFMSKNSGVGKISKVIMRMIMMMDK